MIDNRILNLKPVDKAQPDKGYSTIYLTHPTVQVPTLIAALTSSDQAFSEEWARRWNQYLLLIGHLDAVLCGAEELAGVPDAARAARRFLEGNGWDAQRLTELSELPYQ